MEPMPSLAERMALADKLRRFKAAVAEAVTEEFFLRHPDWLVRYGVQGRKYGIEDACFHIDFLAGAVESGSCIPFEDYCRWTVRMLGARRIAAHFVVENLEQLDQAIASRLLGTEYALVHSLLRAGCAACQIVPGAEEVSKTKTGLGLTQSVFLQSILKNQRHAAVTAVSEALREGHGVLDIYVEVLQESLYQVGRLWESNQITVAEEHMATAITQYVVAQTYAQLPTSGMRRGNMVMTGVAGELHQVGANMVADVLESKGYDVCFLGTNMPHAGIIQQIENHRAELLGISATMLFNIPQVVQLIADVRTKLGVNAPKIVLGGAAFRNVPSLGSELGASAATDLRAAVTLLCA